MLPKTTNDTLIFQHVLSNSVCARWLAVTAPVTLEYCLAHKMDFRLVAADLSSLPGGPGHWAVPKLIREFMDMGYANIIYLDADTLIADRSTDLREAIKPDTIGVVWHSLFKHNRNLSHFNVGALYVSNTEKVRKFVDQWLASLPGIPDFPWWEQGVFNKLGLEMKIIERLDNKWNAENGVSPSNHPVVLGFHGFPDQLGAIKETISRSMS
jgi:hypothetical protein